jgi:hypothetical protein
MRHLREFEEFDINDFDIKDFDDMADLGFTEMWSRCVMRFFYPDPLLESNEIDAFAFEKVFPLGDIPAKLKEIAKQQIKDFQPSYSISKAKALIDLNGISIDPYRFSISIDLAPSERNSVDAITKILEKNGIVSEGTPLINLIKDLVKNSPKESLEFEPYDFSLRPIKIGRKMGLGGSDLIGDDDPEFPLLKETYGEFPFDVFSSELKMAPGGVQVYYYDSKGNLINSKKF